MTVEQMRAQIIAAYPGSDSWAFKVKKMDENQILAVYRRFQRAGKV